MKGHAILLLLGIVLVGSSLLVSIDTATADRIQNLPHWLAVLSETRMYLGRAVGLPFLVGIAMFGVVAFQWRFKMITLWFLVAACTGIACIGDTAQIHLSYLLNGTGFVLSSWLLGFAEMLCSSAVAVVVGRVARHLTRRKRGNSNRTPEPCG